MNDLERKREHDSRVTDKAKTNLNNCQQINYISNILSRYNSSH